MNTPCKPLVMMARNLHATKSVFRCYRGGCRRGCCFRRRFFCRWFRRRRGCRRGRFRRRRGGCRRGRFRRGGSCRGCCFRRRFFCCRFRRRRGCRRGGFFVVVVVFGVVVVVFGECKFRIHKQIVATANVPAAQFIGDYNSDLNRYVTSALQVEFVRDNFTVYDLF
ncbi:hypothetical protein EGW08_014210, partial [Elysia chlorotica]